VITKPIKPYTKIYRENFDEINLFEEDLQNSTSLVNMNFAEDFADFERKFPMLLSSSQDSYLMPSTVQRDGEL